MADDHSGDGTLAQILLAVGGMQTQLAVIGEQLKAIPDHESRIRSLETARAKLYGASAAAGTISGGAVTLVTWALTRR